MSVVTLAAAAEIEIKNRKPHTQNLGRERRTGLLSPSGDCFTPTETEAKIKRLSTPSRKQERESLCPKLVIELLSLARIESHISGDKHRERAVTSVVEHSLQGVCSLS